MLRLPDCTFRRPANLREAAAILAGEGSQAMLVAGGADLWPKMKRRQMEPRVVIGGITSAPFLSAAAAEALVGQEMTRATIEAAARAARLESRPLDNTDLDFSWRRAMVEVWVRRALEQAALRLQLKSR
jgi:CO/xanthine dehydrogenase FAD-binding subunit